MKKVIITLVVLLCSCSNDKTSVGNSSEKLDTVTYLQLDKKGNVYYEKGKDNPFSGIVISETGFGEEKGTLAIQYRNGLKDGDNIGYDKNGVILSNFIYSKNVLQEMKLYTEKGILNSRIICENGVEVKMLIYDSTGKYIVLENDIQTGKMRF